MEIWRAITGTKGFIEVSNKGRVRSLLRGTPRILKTQTDKKGYHRVRATIEREKLSYKVHREIAKAFIPNPSNLPQVNHKDGNKDNNNPMNRPDVDPRADYQGGDLVGITEIIKSGYFNKMGFTTIWMTPLNQNPYEPYGEQMSPVRTKFSGYHGRGTDIGRYPTCRVVRIFL